MKYKNIHNLIIEGPDGVGKTTLLYNLLKKYNYRYSVYDRGEISNYVYAKKYNRPYYVTQNGLPLLYILLLCDAEKLTERIKKRAIEENWTDKELNEELKKVNDSKLFEEAAKHMEKQYDIIYCDTTNLTEEEVLEEVCNKLNERYKSLPDDEKYSDWNNTYKRGCDKLGLEFKVVDNQPYIDGIPANAESTLHNGVYETFTDKTVADNFIYTLGYGHTKIDSEKTHDFQYIINSKILNRPEVLEYYKAFAEAGKSCITSEYETIPDYETFTKYGRIFGDEYLKLLSQAKATVYTARDLEYLKLQTARLYEAIIAQNILFVDKYSDLDNDMLKNIYGENSIMVDLLTVTPENIIERYNHIVDSELNDTILEKQNAYFKKLIKTCGRK
jgi:broad-specificity NMP kinase